MAGELLAVSLLLDQGDRPGVPRGDRGVSRGVLKRHNYNVREVVPIMTMSALDYNPSDFRHTSISRSS